MEKDFLIARFAGALLGMAVGDAMGACAVGLSPYLVMRRYQLIDGYHMRKDARPGQYTCCSRLAFAVAKSIQAAKEVRLDAAAAAQARPEVLNKCMDLDPLSREALVAFREGKPAPSGCQTSLTHHFCSKAVPVGLYAAATGADELDLLRLVKNVAVTTHPFRPSILAAYCIAKLVRDSVRCHAVLTNPYEWFQGDKSLLARMIEFVRRGELSMEGPEILEDNLLNRLIFTRRKLQAGASLETFAGLNGTSESVMESVPLVLFTFLKDPDSFSAVIGAATLGGSSAVNAALTGALVGAYTGAACIPEDMRKGVENYGRILELSESLADALYNTTVDTAEKKT